MPRKKKQKSILDDFPLAYVYAFSWKEKKFFEQHGAKPLFYAVDFKAKSLDYIAYPVTEQNVELFYELVDLKEKERKKGTWQSGFELKFSKKRERQEWVI
ncbi:MAG: hypothetical protein BLM47_01970 [Candidatus Reconcilbacillus cellulovorans]|uniref:Uncharacterized protein n=1 Tax=Candidatus Reconcilbacillus cellulovorans TaxID=1906605 RepID=A0A2A6E3C1_9BACL|nr:MAG: hypothetical protein BLM47_01970 [Candidatus Reconcilbacillus cellulovorans]